jgi:hypothetical protein
MSTVKCFEDLEIWKLSRELCKSIFQIVEKPKVIKSGFTIRNQIMGSSGSISNFIKYLKRCELKGNKCKKQ